MELIYNQYQEYQVKADNKYGENFEYCAKWIIISDIVVFDEASVQRMMFYFHVIKSMVVFIISPYFYRNVCFFFLYLFAYYSLYYQIFPMNFICPKKEVVIEPEKWEQNIGDSCLSCKVKLLPDQCISLCRCYLFCHESCFLKQYSPYISDNQILRCQRCQQQIKFDFAYIYKWQLNKKPLVIIPVIASILLSVVLLILVGVGVFQGSISNGAGYAIFGIFLVISICSFVYSLRRKYINLDDVRVTNTNLLGNADTGTNLKSEDYENDLKKSKNGISQKQLAFEIA